MMGLEVVAKMTETADAMRLCPNCGAGANQNYCPNCGQGQTNTIIPIGHLFRDVLDQFLLLDSKLIRTLKPLFFRPGFLTNEYICGRRAQYVSPFRIYFVISAIYFLGFSIAHYDVDVMRGLAYTLEQAHPSHRPDALRAEEAGARHLDQHGMGMTVAMSHVKPLESDRAHRHHRAVKLTSGWFIRNQSLITFLLVPMAALLLKLLYLKTKRLYIEHLVFAVHIQSFLFALLLPALLPFARSGTYLLALGLSALYLFVAMRTVYRQNSAITLLNCGMMLAGYVIAMALTAAAAFMLFYMYCG